ncbi:glycosyltransferase [Chryseobacterium sp. JAH]|uniref:glycosyltransferase n=1 Tax=Chryseobacterium sp. JAH TaxID=1742858 RepID=UPI0007413150|nr:glycosyltransferase [Chryseobacterium sp. JAH]KUJ52707.1 hypothetical protein AR685_06775 [Chryseobacterium sp. JAH]
MKKIAYIEIDTHAEIAQDFIDLLHDSKEFSVDYYFSEKIKNQIIEGEEVVHISDSSMILDQLSTKKYDLVIIGTVHRYFNTFLAISEKYNTSVIVHNLNFSKISKSDLIKNIFKNDLIYRLKLWWKEGLFYANKTYAKAKHQLVLDQEFSSVQFEFLPLFYTKSFEKTKNEDLIIVIPGGVSQKRRNYKHIIETIQNCDNKENLTFVFLGKATGDELRQIINLGRSLENINITYFSERVSPENFDQWMRKADVLWCPIQRETEFFSNKEIYGKTKMTGNLGDAIKYGKPAVFPKNYSSKLEFIIPEEENAIEQFIKLKNFQYNFQQDFSREKIQKDAEVILHQLISI